MQEDMHYYGTYAMARAAGLEVNHAQIIAYAAQYVDDSTANDSEVHNDGGMFQAIATAHTNSEAISNAAADHTEQRKVWVPFHFFPGNEGNTLSEKLLCVKDGKLAQEMVRHHIQHAVSVKHAYGLTLMGIMAHVYADTFSHYGFSGVSSRNNAVDSETFQFEVNDSKMLAYINTKFDKFLDKYTPKFIITNWRKLASEGAQLAVGSLGHGGVGTYPDRPFLKWKFIYKKSGNDSGWRINSETYLEACEKLYNAFSEYANKAKVSNNPISFSHIKNKVSTILQLEADKQGRINAWKQAITQNELFEAKQNEALEYSDKDWEKQKHQFAKLKNSHDIIHQQIYQFHQAAIYHRDYTLKQLLPKYDIAVL